MIKIKRQRKKFKTSLSTLQKYLNQKFEILEILPEMEQRASGRLIDGFKVIFSDGFSVDAFKDEVQY